MPSEQQVEAARGRMSHFGDPCIHCGMPHDEVRPGRCEGDATKAIPISYCRVDIRWDGVAHYLIRMSSGEVRDVHRHVSEHAPYYHFGHSDVLVMPPRYEPNLRASS